MPQPINIEGQRFGHLTVSGTFRSVDTGREWLCHCDCGNTKWVATSALRRDAKSCGCVRKENATRHGHRRPAATSPTYQSWGAMRRRCNNPNASDYDRYGGRGIKVCERWATFENFLADMGERPDGMTLDRYPDNNGNYEPGNCRWATPSEQQRNKG